MGAWEYAPLNDDGSAPSESDYLKAGPRLADGIGFGKNTVFIAGGHCSSFSGACFKFHRVLEHPLLSQNGFENYRVYEPVSTKQSVMIFRQVSEAIKIYHVEAVTQKLAKISGALSGNFVCEMVMDGEWTMGTFKKNLKNILVDMNIMSMQQPLNIDVVHSANMKVKRFFKDDEDAPSKRARV